MGLVNTSRSIYQKMTGQEPDTQVAAGANPSPGEALGGSDTLPPETAGGMPDQTEQRPIEDNPDDESSEGDPDREGNTDPGTNQPPFDPEAVRRAAMEQAASDIRAVAMAEAEAALPRKVVNTLLIELQTLKYLSIADSKGMYHVTGFDGKGAPFTVTEDAPPNATVEDITNYLGSIMARFG